MWPFDREKRASIEDPRVSIGDPQVLDIIFGQQESEAGEPVSADTALKVPAIWSAVNFLSSTLASLPLQVFRRTEEGRELDTQHPTYRLLHDAPNPEWSSFRWRKYMMTRVLLQGRGLSFIERNRAGRVMNIWPLRPSQITIKTDDMGRTLYERKRESGKVDVYQANEILDIPFLLDEDGLASISPIERLKDVIGLSIALQKYAARHFKSGGLPPMALEGPAMSPAAAQRAGQDVRKAISDAVKSGGVPALPEGYKLNVLGIDPEKSQMEKTRRFQLEEIARVYNLSPIFLQDLTHGTFSNTEQQDLHVVKHTLGQWLNTWESEFNLKLYPANNQTRFAEFNVDGLLRGDFKTRMDGSAVAIQNGIKTPNEIRRQNNDKPMEGGDQLFIQMNHAPLGQADMFNQEGDDADTES